MSPNGSGPHHPLFSKPGFPFNNHFPHGMGLPPFHDLSPGSGGMLRPQHSPGSRGGPHPNSALSPGGHGPIKSELLHLAASSGVPHSPGSMPGFHMAKPGLHSPGSMPGFHMAKPGLLSPGSGGGKMPIPSSPNTQGPPPPPLVPASPSTPAGGQTPNNKSEAGDCGAMDLTKKADAGQKGGSGAGGDCASCVNCSHGSKLKMLRINVVRMLSILVPNLNFEEKGISADSDSVDELLADVIESNTQDDMGH
jgi:hypothetical protein